MLLQSIHRKKEQNLLKNPFIYARRKEEKKPLAMSNVLLPSHIIFCIFKYGNEYDWASLRATSVSYRSAVDVYWPESTRRRFVMSFYSELSRLRKAKLAAKERQQLLIVNDSYIAADVTTKYGTG